MKQPIFNRKNFTTAIVLYQNQDPRYIGTYTASEAASYLHLAPSTVRMWVFGTRDRTKRGAKSFESIVQPSETGVRLLSFINLVELHVLSAIRRHHRISLKKVRQSIAYIQKAFNTKHPLACQQLYTDGVDLFIDRFGELMNASNQGQMAIPEILQLYLQRIEWDERGWAYRLYPFARSSFSKSPKSISIDPCISFGQPVLAGTGIPTAMLAQRYVVGESISELATDYGCERLKVEEAIRYELALVA
ncbi:MAG: DUF433 domain-containing protein [Cyanobacteriota bacterium]|nr:DUF433 domain-containing protein [Cyanobacteriota bacterium]